MSRLELDDFDIEPERYELHEEAARARAAAGSMAAATANFELSRRDLLKALGYGIFVIFVLPEGTAEAQDAEGRRRRGGGGGAPAEIGGWLHIGEDGAIAVYTGKTEVGQGIRTSLGQVVAEELRAPLSTVRLVMADTELTPFDGGTSGSRTTPGMAPQLRRAAAAARELLIDLAAREWKENRADLKAADGRITSARTGQSFEYGKLTHGRKLVEAVSDSVPTRPAPEWQVAGQPVPRTNGRDIVTGRHGYTTDVRPLGLRHGKVLRPPAYGATLVSLDAKAAEAMPGVTVVRDGEFVGVVASNEPAAALALAALKAEWKASPQPSQKELFDLLRRSPEGGDGGRGGRVGGGGGERGSIEQGLAAADVKLEATYTIAYIAHAPMEPRAAVAEPNEDRWTIHTGTQRPFGVRGEVARALGIPEERVRVIVPDTGSGYGGKHSGEVAVEAARLARAAKAPVKLVWTREEEFTWAYFRPAGVIDVKSGVTMAGIITAWEFHNYNSGGSSIEPLYEIPNLRTAFHSGRSPLRQGSYRALAATANTFARESHLDDLARAIGMDPLQLRRKNLRHERLRAILDAAAERFGWDTTKPAPGRGFGIACGSEKGSYVASCAEVSASLPAGKKIPEVKVERVVTAFECGAILNPDNLRNQVEGCIVMGIGGALFEAIDFENGKILNASFEQYRVPRMSDLPRLETVLLDRKDLPSAGAGETPIVCIAPAIGNAIAAATGVRLRSLPMLKES